MITSIIWIYFYDFYFYDFLSYHLFLKNYYLFIYLFIIFGGAVLGLRFCARASSSCGKRGPLFIAVRGPLSRPLLLWSTGSRRAGSVIMAHGPSCSAACGILPDQGSNPCALHWQADSQPLRHQGSPHIIFLNFCPLLPYLSFFIFLFFFPFLYLLGFFSIIIFFSYEFYLVYKCTYFPV